MPTPTKVSSSHNDASVIWSTGSFGLEIPSEPAVDEEDDGEEEEGDPVELSNAKACGA
jgi:hypothetical protein